MNPTLQMIPENSDKISLLFIGAISVIFCQQCWRLCNLLWPSEDQIVNSHRAHKADLEEYTLKLRRSEESKHAKMLRDSWIVWNKTLEEEFQNLWGKEQSGTINESEIDRLDTLTICKHKSENAENAENNQ